MPKQITYPAHVIAGRGRKIELIDGHTAVLVFGFASIMRIEEKYESIELALTQLGEKMKLGTVVELMAAGLLHEGHPTAGALSDVESLAPLLDTQKIADYSDAIGEAFELSFPKSEDPDAEADPQTLSPGESGSTPQQSSSDEQPMSSGG